MNLLQKTSHTIVFTIGLNQYHKLYDRCIQSQRAYAQRQGYDYHIVTGGAWLPEETSRLKIPLMKYLLEYGYEYVFFVDADVQIQDRCPAVQVLGDQYPDHAIYMSTGKSGQINAGVFVVRNTPESIGFLNDVYDRIEEPLPVGIDAPWENGRVIAQARNHPCVKVVDQRRNNSVDPELDDYCRHYVWASVMGPQYHKTPQEVAIDRYLKRRRRWLLRIQKALRVVGLSLYSASLKTRVLALFRLAVRTFPQSCKINKN